jgi:hypothetical protein
MPEYDNDFAAALAASARTIIKQDGSSIHANRIGIYLSLLSIEISLKSFLERGGYAISKIRSHQHDLKSLLKEVGKLRIAHEVLPHTTALKSAAKLRAIEIEYEGAMSTVGKIIDFENPKPSSYPNELRYGGKLIHFPTEALIKVAEEIARFVRENWDHIQKISEAHSTCQERG